MRIPYKSLTFWIFVGLFAGIICGRAFGESIVPLAEPLSDVFLRLLRMAIMPLIVTSITAAVISVGERRDLGLLGARTLGYYVTTSLLAILTGLTLVNVFRPGVGSAIELEQQVSEVPATQQSFGEILIEIIPENPFAAVAAGDVLPVIFFSILFGYFVTRLEEPYRSKLGDLFQAAFEAMMKLTRFVVWSAPLGVFGINAVIVATTGFEAFRTLGFYFVVVLIGLFIHAFVTLPLLLYFVTRINPVKHYKGMPPPLVTAFSTCSSIVTLPLTMEAVTDNSKVPEKISSFVLPIGATVNMDGTALYECVATIFIAQIYGIGLSLGEQLLVVLTALLASIGAASVPMAGLVMMSIILTAVGLPLEGVAIILAVDRILDMFRTAVNVLSDSCGSVIVARLGGEGVLGEVGPGDYALDRPPA
ncbi:MAG: dicarboxylate/amino acid:cation symporter [Gemmatimonadetes bacterium]|uniref:Dicarboxylate/amino acid:cation symporter n=1 Tax=Candidatus Kutchimonas denitrificans TaxID=3056748 RepID=A0AAE4Z8F5_9BACT|nr:dicarboxylate/amino acid:cation symporter [Gemmatimonadota bacterium]NIR74091.1 dicarboxylate/amino acid:cation symporter [Candidatus Kutchimonas denitrificans]NIS01653.1 dicarboxylate/amino acid:cation symporter [Gemmatimonadota bacterium]NIT67391.1 dicarboxylate/amino acid:cation symporter [Gemmatimonadota bacterium]NIU52754.1 cation:dicarboxylase symporter family transporter [Gemmatimonadota bacterium]